MISDNMFDGFRHQQRVERQATDRNAAKFIFRGSMAAHIIYQEEEYDVGFVYDNREEEDKAYLYVLKPTMFDIGQTFLWIDHNEQPHHYIIYDEEKSVKKVDYNKYLVFECNVQLDDVWGYLSGPRSTYVNTQLRQSLYEVSLAKPVLITGAEKYNVADILSIGERNWRIIEKDNYSAPGLVYYYLEQYVAQKDTETAVYSFVDDPVPEADQWRPGETVVLSTEDGYFESDYELNPTISMTTVTFVVPYDVAEINVVYKTDGVIQSKTYKVVMEYA